MIHNPFLRLLFVVLLFLSTIPAQAFQVADGTPPAPSTAGKYIFYWGKHQCNLSEAEGYRSTLSLSTAEFRQMLLGAPKVWNGAGLVPNLRFRLEDMTVSADGYLGQLAQLDAELSPKIKPGGLLRLTELNLEEGVLGAIDIRLQTEEKEDNKALGYRQPANFLNENFLEKAVWGREDIYEISNRDFFTVGEFWSSIRQEPAVVWAFYRQPQILRSDINFTSKDNTSFSVVARLENDVYRSMLENLENYRYMVHPDATVTLQLQTADQYELLYKKTLRIVADDDPRLRLRRKRDQHTVTIRWGDWWSDLTDLYLQQLQSPQGENLETDMAISRSDAWSFSDDRRINWGKQKPACWVDGALVSGNLSFRATVSDSLVFYINSDTYDTDSISRFFLQRDLITDRIKVDSIQVEGYALPPITFTFYVIEQNSNPLLKTHFNNLQKLSENPSTVKLSSPNMGESDVEFAFDLPGQTPIAFNVFEPEGWNTFQKLEKQGVGKMSIKVPRSSFRNKGKHFAFLNTVYGVSRVEFTVD